LICVTTRRANQHDLSSDNDGAIYNRVQLMRKRYSKCLKASARARRLCGYQSRACARSQRSRRSNALPLNYFYYDIKNIMITRKYNLMVHIANSHTHFVRNTLLINIKGIKRMCDIVAINFVLYDSFRTERADNAALINISTF
jgi:hypothetical protein